MLSILHALVLSLFFATGFDEEKFQEEVKKEEMKPEDTLECQICELVVGSVDQIVSSNRSRVTHSVHSLPVEI